MHRDLASSPGIGFVVDTDMNDPGIHGTAGISNLVQLDLECVCCVLNMQKYALSMGCASRYHDGLKQTSYPSNCRGRSETECR